MSKDPMFMDEEEFDAYEKSLKDKPESKPEERDGLQKAIDKARGGTPPPPNVKGYA